MIQVVGGGAAARAAARQFVIGDSTAIRWAKRWRETGSFEAKTNKGRSRSPLRKHEEWLLGLVKQEPDLTLEEIQHRLLAEHQHKAGLGSVWRGRTGFQPLLGLEPHANLFERQVRLRGDQIKQPLAMRLEPVAPSWRGNHENK